MCIRDRGYTIHQVQHLCVSLCDRPQPEGCTAWGTPYTSFNICVFLCVTGHSQRAVLPGVHHTPGSTFVCLYDRPQLEGCTAWGTPYTSFNICVFFCVTGHSQRAVLPGVTIHQVQCLCVRLCDRPQGEAPLRAQLCRFWTPFLEFNIQQVQHLSFFWLVGVVGIFVVVVVVFFMCLCMCFELP